MSNIQKKYIITGAPGTGKTSLINILKKTVPCMDEVSRKVIIEEQKNNTNGTPWGNIERFTKLVFDATTKELNHTNAIICDRSLLDLEAYLTIENKPTPTYLQDFNYSETYHKKVFFAPTWFDIYCKDGQRLQEFEYCLKLEKSLLKHYIKKGFEITMLPKSTLAVRSKMVLKAIS